MERIPLADNPTGRRLVLASIALLALGVVMVHSAAASVALRGPWYGRVDTRHTLFAILAAGVLLTFSRIDYRRLGRGRAVPIGAACLLGFAILCCVLVFVPGVGHSMGGKARWLRVGPERYSIGFQPSELLKISLLVFLAAWLARPGVNVRSFGKTFLPATLLIGLCAGLVVRNDFGSAAILGLTAVAVLWMAGVPGRYLLLYLPVAAGGVWKFIVNDPARWPRIEALLDPWSTANPAAFQPRQSLLAVLNGGWFGQGPGNGVLKLGYLPEDTTDFIFSAYCEEWGFAGAVLLMAILVLWMLQARKTAAKAGEPFGRVLAGGLGFLVAVQAVLHIAVDLVLAPPTGMSLPFVSAGGTSLLATALATAMIVSVSAHSPAEAAGECLGPDSKPSNRQLATKRRNDKQTSDEGTALGSAASV